MLKAILWSILLMTLSQAALIVAGGSVIAVTASRVIMGTLAVMLGSLLLKTPGSHDLFLTIQVIVAVMTVICSFFLKMPPEEKVNTAEG